MISKLNIGDHFRYKSEYYNFEGIMISKKPLRDERIEYRYKVISGNFNPPGKIGTSYNTEDNYITILKREEQLKNLEAKNKKGETIKTRIWKKI